MSRKRFIVVGAGLGGLATALRLAHRGHDVTILEKTDQIGGRNRVVTVNGCTFDGGPTLLMMLDPFRKLFTDIGERMEDHLSIELCDPSYRVFWDDGKRIDATTNVAKMVQRIQETFNREDSLRYPKLLGDLAELYQASIPPFVEKNFYNPLSMFGPKQLAAVVKHRMTFGLFKRVTKYVKDPHLQMLFSFQSMYLGLSPYDARWVYATLTYMEYGEGIWYPKGGIVEVCKAVERLAERKGVEIRLNSPVAKIDGKSVTLESGEVLSADAIICNADLPYAEKKLQAKPAKNRRYSCSTFMLYIDYEGSLPQLLHHNVFFGRDFEGNFEQIFKKMERPDSPAFYAAVSSRSEPAKSTPGHENLYILVPCANLDRPWSEEEAEALKATVFARLEKEVGFESNRVRGIKTYSPQDWADDLNLDRGAAFGLSADFMQSAVFRPQNKSKSNPNLYFVGASTVPGNGLPMVLISAQLAEERLAHDGFI